ncbi:MAG TPA: bifunctional DNA primase/polymerase [Actinomycetota bacterium]|nr:bifunctional DNA primase/polymerase [Actinomycetota bacterium]
MARLVGLLAPGDLDGGRAVEAADMTPLDAALAYCAHGWSVIPCNLATKRSLVRWREWQRRAPGLEQLEAWWERWPKANVGVVTGSLSGVVVVDVDPQHDGDRTLAELEGERGALPRTAVVETPSGGHHLYFAHPGGRVANSAGRLGAGVDVRGDGGLALLPPSRLRRTRLRDDRIYRWTAGGPATVPELPPAWVELGHPPKPPAAATRTTLEATPRDAARLAGLLRALQRAPEGRRNAVLYWAGCRLAEMVERGAPASWADVLVRAGVAAGPEPGECRDTVASALGRVAS